ncbi:Short-chain dehydrogenase/reductase SDR [Trypanosoma melophagium]|uniref:Short-chain dehydrogenase/reductase SDR n=1 Tax=Trypanosoma melophagium TaxID=715481 RepID=UPI00351A8C50|nr:Short-chain dehydrogenase/reductase SDR [Trypanosoma melophagium]
MQRSSSIRFTASVAATAAAVVVVRTAAASISLNTSSHGSCGVRHYHKPTGRLLRPRKLSQAKQKPLYPGMYNHVKKFDGEYTYNHGSHTFAIIREGSIFAILPVGCLIAYSASYFPQFAAVPMELQALYLLLLAGCTRWTARGRQNRERKDLMDRHVVITGGTSGIGRETAAQLASMGANVTVLSRNGPHVDAAMKYIRKFSQSESQEIHFTALDLADFIAVRDYCKRARHNKMTIDILVNNAGLMEQNQVMTRFGDDEQLAVNLLGPFLLTEGLLPLVAENKGRVVYVSCSAHVAVKGNIVATYLSGRGLWSPRVRDKFDGLEQYGFTKLGCIYHAQNLAARSYVHTSHTSSLLSVHTSNTSTSTNSTDAINNNNNSGSSSSGNNNSGGGGSRNSNSNNSNNNKNNNNNSSPLYTCCVAVPSAVVTNLYRHVPLAATFRWGRYFYLLFMRTPYEGSQVVVNCCVREELVNGGYYQNCRYSPSGLSAAACNVEERNSVLGWVRKKMQPYMRWDV